jgi:small multidrug resistance family-3 protein
MILAKTVLIFILAGLCEISGGYLIWIALREGKSPWYAAVGAMVLFCYGYIATLQASNFARVYATYGGFFIVLSLLWAWKFDRFIPDRYDIIGAIVVLVGVAIIYYGPRSQKNLIQSW